MSRSNREIADWIFKNAHHVPEETKGYLKARVRAALGEKDLACERECDLARSGGYLEGSRNRA